MNPIFKSSEGCMVVNPISIHLVAPPWLTDSCGTNISRFMRIMTANINHDHIRNQLDGILDIIKKAIKPITRPILCVVATA